MNADYINPFIQGSQSVLSTLCGETPALGRLKLKKTPYAPSPLTVSISILGDIQGIVLYSMAEPVGCYIASAMMFGMPVPALDDMSRSAVSEMANMISGSVATLFSNKGLKVDITPPLLFTNATSVDFPSLSGSVQVVSVPLNFNSGHVFEIDLVLQ